MPVFFLPPNITSLIQLIDQGIAVCFKFIGENCCLENSGLVDAVKTINIKHVAYMVAITFEEITHTIFIKIMEETLSGYHELH